MAPAAEKMRGKRAAVEIYRAARARARWRLTWRLRWQLSRAQRRASGCGLDMAEWVAVAAVRHELEARGVHVRPIRPS